MNPERRTICATSALTSILITIGILLVCFTMPKPTNQPCKHIFNTTLQHETGYNSRPRSAVVHDLNNDNQLDMVVANAGTNTVGVFLSSKDGNFRSQTTYSTGYGSQPYSVILGDFNNDDRIDIATANYGTNSIGVLVGYGDGTFAAVHLYSLDSSRPVSIATDDLNNDQKLDIIVVNHVTSTIGILFGYGNASFSTQIKYSTGYDSFPYSIIVSDLNRDSYLDIVTSNSGTHHIAVLLGYSNGSFSSPKLYSTGTGSRPLTVAVGDLNRDGHMDIVVTMYWSSSIGVLLGYGNGTFNTIETCSVGASSRPHSILIQDFNQDSILDVVVVNSENDTIHILHGSGNGVLTIQETYLTDSESNPIFAIFGDFDNDNQLDLATTNNGTNTITVFLRYLTKKFTDQTKYPTVPSGFPRSAVLGDFNNDSLLDIVVANRDSDNVSILLGYQNGTFEHERTVRIGFNSSRSIAVGDFNNDSLLDVIVAGFSDGIIGILLSYGNGSFTSPKIFSTGTNSRPISIAIGDVNKDQILDVVVADFATHCIAILFGYGDGTFATPKKISIGDNSYPYSIALCDFNNDDLLDIAVANPGNDNVVILLGNADGRFAIQMAFSTGDRSYPNSVTCGHFNNDSLLDIAVANYRSNEIGVLLGSINGYFENVVIYSLEVGSHPTSLVLGDFNNDNIVDIAISNAGANSIGILFGYGNGTFGMLTIYATGDGSRPISIATGNLNSDNWLDIVVANSEGSNIGVFLGLDYVYAAKKSSVSTGSGSHPYSVVAVDFNNDTALDLMIVNAAHDNVAIRLGYGNGLFADEIIYPVAIGSRPQFATVGDFNNDYILDVVIVNTMHDSITIAFGCGNGTFTSPKVYSTGHESRPHFAIAGDMNNDNRLDLIILNEVTNTVGVFLSFNYATFKIESLSSTGMFSYPIAAAIGDFNNDSLPDIAVVNRDAENIGVFLGYSNGSFKTQDIYSTGERSRPLSLAVGDLNNDHVLDIVVTNSAVDKVSILFGYGDGTFTTQKTFSTGKDSYPYAVVVDDFNNDHLLDIVVANSMADNVGIFIGHTDGSFEEQKTFSTGYYSTPISIAVGHFNNDTFLDIAVANSLVDNMGILLGYGDGNFAIQEIFLTGNDSGPFSITTHDINNDGLLDVAVVNRLANNIGIFLGYGNGSFAPQRTFSTGDNSIPVMITVGYLNDDNMPDIVVANYGANNVGIFFGYGDGSFTQQIILSTGSGTQPSAIVIGDFNNDSRSDFVVTNFQDATVMVFLRDSSESFQTMTSYSTGNHSRPQSMDIADFNNDHYLDIVVSNADSDNIGILLGHGNGTLTKQTTYATGDGSRPGSVAIADFNNDSIFDVAVANVGTNTLGIFLGYGNGTFSAPTLFSTGIQSSPHSISVADINRDSCLDLIVANSRSKTMMILFGDCTGAFEISNSYALGYSSQPYSVAVGDFNGDSWIDMAVADYGTDSVQIYLQTCEIN